MPTPEFLTETPRPSAILDPRNVTERVFPLRRTTRRGGSGGLGIMIVSLASAALLACSGAGATSGPQSSGSNSTPSVASLEIQPPRANVFHGDSAVLAVRALDSSGNVVTVSGLTWETSDPNVVQVDDFGALFAIKKGSTDVTVSGHGHKGSAKIVVTGSASGVRISPKTDTIAVGDTDVLTAYLVNSSGDTILANYKWEIADSSVLQVQKEGANGEVTLQAVGQGTTLVTATSHGMSASATVTAEGGSSGSGTGTAPDTTSSAPPSGSSEGHPHEPSGYVGVTDRPFDSKAEAGWDYNDTPNFSIADDTSAASYRPSPPSVGVATYPTGYAGGSAPMNTWYYSLNSDGPFQRLYVSFWMKLSPNWYGHSSGVNKILFITAAGSAGNPVYLSAQGSGSGRLQAQVRLQGTPAGARNLVPNVQDLSVTRGQWHHWELVLEMNTSGNADGSARWWLDGVEVGRYNDVEYVDASATHTWDGVKWAPVWGGIGETVPQTMTMSMDQIYVSGAP